MKNIFKKSYLALVALAALTVTSCQKSSDYIEHGGNKEHIEVSGAQVYFDKDAPTIVNLLPDSTKFSVTVKRVVSETALVVPLTVEYPDSCGIVSVDKTVSFAAGESTAEFAVEYDPAYYDRAEMYGKYDTLCVTIGKETSAYGVNEIAIAVGMPEPWSEIGKATYIDDYYFGNETKVSIYQNDLDPSLYRMPNPYVSLLNAYGDPVSKDASDWMYIRILKQGETILGQTVPEDGMVYFYGNGTANSVNTGYTNPNYSDDVCLVFPGVFTDFSDPSFWMHNVVLDYKEDGTPGAVQLAPYYYMFSVGGWNATQEDGDVTIYFPGYDPKDFSLDVKFDGRLIDAKENGTAIFNVTKGADVKTVKYLMQDGKDAGAIYAAIMQDAEGVQELTESGEIRIPYEGFGDKTLVLVGFDADDNEVAAIYTTINIPNPGQTEETWTQILEGNYYHCVRSYSTSGTGVWSEGQSMLHQSAMFVSDQDNTRYKMVPWIDNELIFTMDEEGNIVVDNADTGVDNGGVNIAATDFITAQLANLQSVYDADNSQFVFYLGWHDMDDLESGYYGFTADVYAITNVLNAPSKVKLCAPQNKLFSNVKKSFAYKLDTDLATKAPAKFRFAGYKKQTFKKAPRL